MKKVDKVAVLLQSSKNAKNEKNDVKKMKKGFLIEQCLHALFECHEDVNKITKHHAKVVCDEFCVISLFLRKLILRVT